MESLGLEIDNNGIPDEFMGQERNESKTRRYENPYRWSGVFIMRNAYSIIILPIVGAIL